MLGMSRTIFIGIVKLLCYERCSLTAGCFYRYRLIEPSVLGFSSRNNSRTFLGTVQFVESALS